jgi:hypothetical protein
VETPGISTTAHHILQYVTKFDESCLIFCDQNGWGRW